MPSLPTPSSSSSSRSTLAPLRLDDHLYSLQLALGEEITKSRTLLQRERDSIATQQMEARSRIRDHSRLLVEAILRRQDELLSELSDIEERQVEKFRKREEVLLQLKDLSLNCEEEKSRREITRLLREEMGGVGIKKSENADREEETEEVLKVS